jgi:pyruvate dehydrogenase E1 component alpha subunit
MGVGAALANALRGGDEVVAIFLGDGALNEGVFFEALNFAALKRLRVLFVCEDNGLAIHSRTLEREGYEAIAAIVRQYRCDVYSSESTVAAEIHKLTVTALEGIRQTGRPAFLHLRYCRYLEHVGINEDYDFGYRSREEVDVWRRKDPVALQRELAVKEISSEAVKRLEQELDRQVSASVQRAEALEFPLSDQLYTDVMP